MKLPVISILLGLMTSQGFSADPFEMPGNVYFQKIFIGKKTVELHTLAGNCTIRRSGNDTITVELIADITQENTFEPELTELDDAIVLHEHFTGIFSGKIHWIITAPENTSIRVRSPDGNVELEAGKDFSSVPLPSNNDKGN